VTSDTKESLRVLFVCTANVCRSPMAAGFLVAEAQRHSVDSIRVGSAGQMEGGQPADPHVVDILANHGIDLSRKRSRQLNLVTAVSSDLILTMTTRHTRHVVSQFPEAASRTFAMKDFVQTVRRRRQGTPISEWIATTNANKADMSRYLADGSGLDIPDPIGEPRAVFVNLADEMIEMVAWIARCSGLYQLAPQPPAPTGYRYRKLVGRRRSPRTEGAVGLDSGVELDVSDPVRPPSSPVNDE